MKKSLILTFITTLTLLGGWAHASSTNQSTSQSAYNQLTPEERNILDRGEIGTGEYVGGGVVGTLIGLGIGHAIQGRYSEKGWIFTAGELGSVGVVSIGATSCIISGIEEGDCGTGAVLMTAGLAGILIFRVWEIVDVWAGPPELNRRYHALKHRIDESSLWERVHFYPTLVASGGGLGMSLEF